MKQHLELPSGERVFYGVVAWIDKLSPMTVSRSFDAHVIANTEEQARELLLAACLSENPSFKDCKAHSVETLLPILFYY